MLISNFRLISNFKPSIKVFLNKPIYLKIKKIEKKKLYIANSLFFSTYMMDSVEKNKSISDGMFLRVEEERKFFKCGPSISNTIEKYSSLHNHSDLSLLDGASRVSEMVRFTKELKITSLSITDHGVMHAIVDLFKECDKLNIKPIAGNEMYVINGNISRNYKKSQLSKYHQIVLALNEQGYNNLVKLTTLSHLNGWQGTGAFGRPCISKKLLFKYKKNIVLTSACLGGEICQNLLGKNFKFARQIADWYSNNFNDFFYLELQDHGHREDRAVNMDILSLSEEFDINLISTNDSHFTKNKNVEAHDMLLCVQTGKPFDEPSRMRYSGTEFLKSPKQMREMYQDHVSPKKIESALESSVFVSNSAENYSIWAEITIPTFTMPKRFNDFSFDEFLEFLSFEGLNQMLNNRFEKNFHSTHFDSIEKTGQIKSKYKRYYRRLSYELESIKKMGFSTYFLVVWDFIDFARKNKIPIGSGRGSVAGSLVAYTLGITNIDPIEYGLLFERFLNPARKSMPDIDTDFSIDGRDGVIDYVSMKYGQDKVAQIITFNRLTSKAVLKDMGRSIRKGDFLVEKMSDLIPISRGKPLDLGLMISSETPSQEFRQNYLKHKNLKNLIDKALNFQGMNKTTAVHAAGLVISSRKLDEIVPLTRGIRGEVITQYPMEDVEYLGLLKMDFLGLKNLSMVEGIVNCVNYRFKNNLLTLDSNYLGPHFDKRTFDLLARGELDGVFQLDASIGMKDIVTEMKPSSIQDISSILALYRPGPLDTGLIPRFIKRKRKVFLYKFDYPELKQTLEETYGILIYQEQIMKVAQELGGYNMSQADILRRAMGKKKISEMRTQEKIFIEGCVNNSLEKISGQIVFNQMLGFAEYCFNKSHSTAYAFTTYQTAWLKSHWPVEFFSSLMNVNLADFEKIERYIHQASLVGIFVHKPEINESEVFFVPDYSLTNKSFISFGLGSIKNIGEVAASLIITERKISGVYRNLFEIVDRLITKQLISKKLVECLIVCGCLDKIYQGEKRTNILTSLENIIEWVNRNQKTKYINQPLLIDLGSIKNEKKTKSKKKTIGDKSINGIDDFNQKKVELPHLAYALTGINSVNIFLLNYSEIILLLGISLSIVFKSPENDINLITNSKKSNRFVQNSFFLLNSIEKIKVSEMQYDNKDILVMGIIFEIQEYRISVQRKIFKLIYEDFNGMVTGIIFENNDSLSEIDKELGKSEGFFFIKKTKFFLGDLFFGYGSSEEPSFESRKIKLSQMFCVNDYRFIIITISALECQSPSVRLLLKFNSSLSKYIVGQDEKSIPLLLKIKGNRRNEILKTNLSVSFSDHRIVIKLLKKVGFKCDLFQLNSFL